MWTLDIEVRSLLRLDSHSLLGGPSLLRGLGGVLQRLHLLLGSRDPCSLSWDKEVRRGRETQPVTPGSQTNGRAGKGGQLGERYTMVRVLLCSQHHSAWGKAVQSEAFWAHSENQSQRAPPFHPYEWKCPAKKQKQGMMHPKPLPGYLCVRCWNC